MFRKIIFVLLLLTVTHYSVAQLWDLKGISGTGLKTATSVFRDEAGNSYVAGTFSDTLNIENQVSVTSGNYDIYIVAYNNLGNVKWVKTFGGNSADYIYDAVYKNGVIYCGGAFLSTSINLQVTTLNNPSGSGGYSDTYVAALDTSGNFLWGKSFGSPGSFHDQISDLEITDDALYAAGSYEGSYNAGNGIVAGSSGQTDACFLKLDLSGNTLWGRFGNGIKGDYGAAIAVDAFGYVYCAGSFGNSSGLGNFTLFIGSYQLTSTGGFGFTDLFVAKFDTAGVFQYARRDGAGDPEIAKKLLVKDGTVILAGNYYYETNLGGTLYATNGGYEGFILALDTALNPQWSQVFTYTLGASSADDNFLGIGADNAGHYLALVQHSPYKHSLYYLNGNGNILSSDDMVSQNNSSYGGGLYIDGSCGSVYVAAGYINTIIAGNDTLNGAYGDVFFGIRSDSSSLLAAPANINTTAPDTICANYPLFNISVDPVAGALQYSWQVSPQNAGTINAVGTNATVNIDANYNGWVYIYCYASSGCSVSAPSDSVSIFVKAVPATPAILVNGLLLTANIFAQSYTWYYNGNVIPNETGISITAAANGTYQVVANFDGCQSGISVGVPITSVGIAEDNIEEYPYILYPNPVSNLLNVEIADHNGSSSLVIYDVAGKEVLRKDILQKQESVSLQGLPPAIYLVRILNEDGKQYFSKIVKI